MLKEILPKLSASPHSAIKMLEDIRMLLGLSQEEVAYILSLLEKADFGMLHFFRGNTDIYFRKLLPEGKCSKITIEMSLEDGDGNRSTNKCTLFK